MKSHVDRKSEIEKALKSPLGQKKLPWKGSYERQPVIKLHGDFLMYRLENSRTRRQQQDYIAKHDLPPDFFKDPEPTESQKAQEEILYRMAKSQSGFIDDLKQRKQVDELIITRDGFIINGNRRTAALKSLGEKYFQCAVLPESTTARDIYELEQELQISTDFKLEYDWINELNNIREGLEDERYRYSERELSDNLRISIQALRSKMSMIQLVDEFLEWRRVSGNYAYSKLDKAEQSFKEIEKAMRKFADSPAKQMMLKDKLFVLVEDPPSEGRIYDDIRGLIKYFDKIVETEETDSNEQPESDNSVADDDISLIMGLEGNEEAENTPYQGEKENKNTAEEIINKIEDAKAEDKDTQKAEAVYQASRDALRKLTGLIVNEDTIKKPEAIKTLMDVIKTSENLIQLLK